MYFAEKVFNYLKKVFNYYQVLIRLHLLNAPTVYTPLVTLKNYNSGFTYKRGSKYTHMFELITQNLHIRIPIYLHTYIYTHGCVW